MLHFNEENLLLALDRNGSCLGAWPFGDEYRPAKRLVELGLAYPVNGTLEIIAITPLGKKEAARIQHEVLDKLEAQSKTGGKNGSL